MCMLQLKGACYLTFFYEFHLEMDQLLHKALRFMNRIMLNLTMEARKEKKKQERGSRVGKGLERLKNANCMFH